MRPIRAVKLTLIVGTVLLLAVCAYTLTRSPPRVVRQGPKAVGVLGGTQTSGEACQANETLPAGVTAIRLSLAAFFGAPVRVTAYHNSNLLLEGRRGPDWTGTSVTVPVRALTHATNQVTLCVDVSPNQKPIYFDGYATPRQEGMVIPGGGSLPGRLGVEDLTPGQRDWWSQALSVARRMGLGHAISGTWVVLLIAAMVAAVGLLAVRLTLREMQ